MKLYFRGLSVFNSHCFRCLSNIFVGFCFSYCVCSGSDTRNKDFALVVGFCRLLEVIACDGKFNAADNSVLGCFHKLKVTCICYKFNNSRYGVGLTDSDNDILQIGITVCNQH